MYLNLFEMCANFEINTSANIDDIDDSKIAIDPLELEKERKEKSRESDNNTRSTSTTNINHSEKDTTNKFLSFNRVNKSNIRDEKLRIERWWRFSLLLVTLKNSLGFLTQFSSLRFEFVF